MLKLMPHLHKKIIHVGSIKLYGSMLSLPFHFCYAVIYLQLEVGPIIIWLVVGVVASLEDKWGYLVLSEKMCGPIIKVSVMAVKEEEPWIELAISIGLTKETRCLHPDIPVHISRRCGVDQPVNGDVPVKIMGVIFPGE